MTTNNIKDSIINCLRDKIFFSLGKNEKTEFLTLNNNILLVIDYHGGCGGIDELIVRRFKNEETYKKLDGEVEDEDNDILYILLPEFSSEKEINYDHIPDYMIDDIGLLNGDDLHVENYNSLNNTDLRLFNKIIKEKTEYIIMYFGF